MYTPFKMKGKSPMMKKLVGNQHRLPEHLKAKIEAAPESPAKMKKKSAAKMAKKSPAKDYRKSLAYRLKGKAGRAKMDAKYSAGEKTKLQKDISNVTSSVDKGIQKVLNNPRGKQRTGENKYVPVKGKKETSKKEPKKTPGKIDWKSAPAVGTKKRTQWYKDNNLKLDDTTPALMKKSAAKMKKAPAKMKKAPAKMKKAAVKMKKSVAKLKKKTKLLKGVKRGALRNAKTSEEAMTKVSLNALQMAVEGGAKKKKTKKGLTYGVIAAKSEKLGKKTTAREQKIARNKEFGKIAIKKGLAPKKPKAGDLSAKGRAELKAYEKFYSNKENVKKLNKAQKDYFKNKK